MDSSKLGAVVRLLREFRHMSQEDLAGLMEMSRTAVVNIENGKRKLSASELIRVAEVFGLTLDQLVKPELRPECIVDGGSVLEIRENSGPRISIPQNRFDKFREVLLYILSRIGARPYMGETVLYKLLYFIDFDYYEKYEEQLIGATYIRNHYGPTPTHFRKLVEEMEEAGILERVCSEYYSYPQTKYLPHREPDLSLLSGRELELIEEVLGKLGSMNARQISDHSHGDVPWMSTQEGEAIDYETVFYRTPEYSVRDYPEDGEA